MGYSLIPQVGGGALKSYASFSEFPVVGEQNALYKDIENNDLYSWDGSAYEQLNGAGGVSETVKIMSSTVRQTGAGTITTLSDLAVTLEANKKYVAIYDFTLTSNGQCSFRFWPTYPTSCVRTSSGAGDFAPADSYQGPEADDGAAQIFQYTMPNSTGYSSFRLQVNVETGASGGTLGMRFSPTMNWGEVRIGSYVILREILATP